MTLSNARVAHLAEIANGPTFDHTPDQYQFYMRELIREVRDQVEELNQCGHVQIKHRKEITALEEAYARTVAFLATVYQDRAVLLEKSDRPGYGIVFIAHHAVGQLAFTVSEVYFDLFPPRVTRVSEWTSDNHTSEEAQMRLQALAAYEWTWHGGIDEPLPPLTPAELAGRPY